LHLFFHLFLIVCFIDVYILSFEVGIVFVRLFLLPRGFFPLLIDFLPLKLALFLLFDLFLLFLSLFWAMRGLGRSKRTVFAVFPSGFNGDLTLFNLICYVICLADPKWLDRKGFICSFDIIFLDYPIHFEYYYPALPIICLMSFSDFLLFNFLLLLYVIVVINPEIGIWCNVFFGLFYIFFVYISLVFDLLFFIDLDLSCWLYTFLIFLSGAFSSSFYFTLIILWA